MFLLTLIRDCLIALSIQFRMVLSQPQVVVGVIHTKVIGQLHVFEASMGPRLAHGCHAIFVKVIRGAEPGLKVGLAQNCGSVVVLLQPVGNGGCVFRQTNPVHQTP